MGFTNAMYDQFTTALTVITEAKLNEGYDIEKFSYEAYKKYLRLNAQMQQRSPEKMKRKF